MAVWLSAHVLPFVYGERVERSKRRGSDKGIIQLKGATLLIRNRAALEEMVN
jgi:hypothetical protein